jgi:DNA-binding GntR family transcriptional regulator
MDSLLMTDGTSNTSGVSPIDFLRTRSLTNVVQTEIERMIVEGEFTPNERINENALAQRLKVSRGPIREACSALVALGLIQVIPNRGFFVRELSEDEAREVSEARAYLFACIVMGAAKNAGEKDIAKLRSLVDRMDELTATGEVSSYYPVNLDFHTELAKCCGNMRLAQIYLGLARELHIQRYRALASGDVLTVSNAEHRAIVDAVAAHDAQRGFAAGYAHITNGTARTRRATSARHHHPATSFD